MAVHAPSVAASRKRKAHKKSRQGCRNCKLRAVKCDESKPKCKKCLDYGVECNYDSKSADLQFNGSGAFSVIEMPQKSLSFNETVLSMINAQPGLEVKDSLPSRVRFQFSTESLELLQKYRKRTGLTLGTAQSTTIFTEEVANLAYEHPFLLHMIVTLTLRHDRFLSAKPNTKPSTQEVYHWYQGTALFNELLSNPIKESDKDALWATSAILGCIAFSYLEISRPTEAWPLSPSSSTDLDWLKMSDGKKAVFKLTNPKRSGSVFRPLYQTENGVNEKVEPVPSELQTLPAEFLKVYDSQFIPGDENPYIGALHILSRLIELECTHDTILQFLSFIGQIDTTYKRLVEAKEPRALLLFSYWLAKLCQYHQWWVWRRAVLECQAICMYLERYHYQETDIVALLAYPKMMCGLFDR